MEDLKSFVVEFTKDMSKYDISEYNSTIQNYIRESIEGFEFKYLIKPNMYVKYIDKSIDNISVISQDVTTLDNFFSNVYKSAVLEDKNITVALQDDTDIIKFRPEYILTLPNVFDTTVKKIISGSVTNYDSIKKYIDKEFIYGSYFNNMKKKLVKTSLAVNDMRDLIKLDNPIMVKINEVYIQNNLLPYIRNYNQNKQDLITTASVIKGHISSSYRSLQDSVNALDTISVSDDTRRHISYFATNFLREYMNVCAYLSYMIIRKISYYTYNMASYTGLYNTIYNFFPEGDLLLHESVIDGDLSDIDDTQLLNSIKYDELSLIIPHIQCAIGKKKMEIANIVSRKTGIKIDYNIDLTSDDYSYDMVPYKNANMTINEILVKLQTFDEFDKTGDVVIDDLIDKADLQASFLSKYNRILSMIADVSYYEEQIEKNTSDNTTTIISLYNDINNYENNITIICRNIAKVYKYIESLKDKYTENMIHVDDNTYNELISFINEILQNYNEYIVQIARKFLNRLSALTYILTDDYDGINDAPEQYTPYDYTLESYLNDYDEIVESTRDAFSRLTSEYVYHKNYKDRGVRTIYEANEKSADTTAKPADNKAKPATSSSTDNKETTGATPLAGDAKASTTDTATTTDKPKDKNGIIERFKKFWNNIMTKFKEAFLKLTGRNNKWLAAIKNKILTADFSKTKVTCSEYTYVTLENINKDINSATAKINTLNVNSLPAELKSNVSKAQRYIFPSIPEGNGTVKSLPEKFKNYFMYGNVDSSEQVLVTYENDEAKTKATNMITFCEKYRSQSQALTRDLNKLIDAASSKQSEILNTSVASKTEDKSSTAKTNTAADNEDKSLSETDIDTGRVLINVCRDYSTSLLTAFEKKYLDYIKVLMALSKNMDSGTTDAVTTVDDTDNAGTDKQPNKVKVKVNKKTKTTDET